MALISPKLSAGPLLCKPLTSEQATLTIKNNSNIPITVASHPQLSVVTVQPNTKTEVLATICQTFQVTSQGQTRNVKVTKKYELLVIDSNKGFTDRGFSSSNEPIRLYPLSILRDPEDIKSTPNSQKTTGIRFTNETDETVHVDWIDFEGQRHQRQTLRAQESYKQASFIGHVWEVVINGGEDTQRFLPTAEVEYIALIGRTDMPILVPIQGNTDGLRSTDGGATTAVIFINRSPSVATIYWINFEGQYVPFKKPKPSEIYGQRTPITHPWKVTAGSKSTYYWPINSDAIVYID